MEGESPGVSVVICCHNSASRLPPTLRHLAAQQVPSHISWEVVVVDNASTDRTREVAASTWPPGAPARLRVVSEPRTGLGFARERGREETCWPIISFIDDDNWVNPDWVALTSEVMSQQPRAGASGGLSEAVCEVSPPPWFQLFSHCYAVGPQGETADLSAGPRRVLWGAGMNVRREAWDGLVRNGFKPLLADRQGTKLSAGGDSELCHALRLAGWELWYDPRLQLKHFIPSNRLRWGYLRRLVRGFGATLMDPYCYETDEKQRALPSWRRAWWMVMLREVRGIPRWLPGCWGAEGDPRVLDAETAIGRWGALLQVAGQFGERCRAIREAPWRTR